MRKIKGIISKVKNNTFWRSVAVLVSGTALAQLLGVLTAPIVSRLYEPRAFGENALIYSTASIIANMVTLGLNSAIMVPVEDDESDEVFMVTFLTMLVLATIILIIMLVVSPAIHFINTEMNYALACVLVYGFVIINNTSGLLSIYINRKGLNRVLFYNSLVGALVTLFVTIPLGIINSGSNGLIIAAIIAGVISIIQMVYHANPFKTLPTLKSLIIVCRKYKDFVIYQYPSNFVENFAEQLPTQVLSSTFGNANLGSYTMNEKVFGIPLRLIGAPISTVYFRTASEHYKKGESIADFSFSLVTKIMLIAFVPMVVLLLWGEQIFSLVFGLNWGEAGRMSSVLVLYYVFMLTRYCTSYTRVVLKRQRVNLAISVIRIIIVCCSLYGGIFLSGNLFDTVLFFAVGATLFLLIDTAVTFLCLGKHYIRYIVFSLVYIIIVLILWFMLGIL